jgi:iron complex transport system ATP-binding protein
VTALRVENLSVTLKGREVVRDVSFSIGAGELVSIIGPNGAGKSTLLKSLVGLSPNKGTVTYGTKELGEIASHDRATLVSYLPQDREVAWPISAAKLVALGRTPYLAPMAGLTEHDHSIIERALQQADAAEFRDRVVSELSGGERARVLIARALAQETPVLIADEPTAGLDPAHQISLMEVFTGLVRGGRTIVVALHEIALAARWCSRIILLDHGRLVADGTPKAVLTSELFERAYGIRLYIAESSDGLVIQPIGRSQTGR